MGSDAGVASKAGVLPNVIDYEEAKQLARHEDEHVRSELAARSDVRPEILYFLTDDPSAAVRQVLAQNDAAPRKADLVLAEDPEESVRRELADKISALVPQLDPVAKDKISRMTVETLEILARDQAVRVRRILSDTLKDLPNVPSSVINRLARDAEMAVSTPVLTFSPVLTDEDLLDIITSGPVPEALGAISQRAEVSESVADAIVDNGDHDAVALLLANASAQIREETLERVIDRAPEVERWHLPLVGRPRLPMRAAVRLASFVAESLVNALQQRDDLDAEGLERIRALVNERIEAGTFDPDWAEEGGSNGDKPGLIDEDDLKGGTVKKRPTTPLDIAIAMRARNELDEAAVTGALDRGDVDLVIAAIAVLGGLEVTIVEHAVDSQEPQSVIAVCWRADLPAKLAERVQKEVSGIAKDDLISATSGRYALTSDELSERLSAIEAEARAKA